MRGRSYLILTETKVIWVIENVGKYILDHLFYQL